MKVKKMMKRLYLGLMIPAASNLPLLIYGLFTGRFFAYQIEPHPISAVCLAVIIGVGWLYFNMVPYRDKNPDFYTATHQFSTVSSKEFNENVPDAPGVFYQSYASKMHDCLSDPLLWIPYCLIKPLEGDNDGLVSTKSARWGEFKTVFTSKGHRGISHGDMIDLKREDYKGFDVVECYVQIVAGLVKVGD